MVTASLVKVVRLKAWAVYVPVLAFATNAHSPPVPDICRDETNDGFTVQERKLERPKLGRETDI